MSSSKLFFIQILKVFTYLVRYSLTIDSRFVRKHRTSRNKMRHSQLEGQRRLEAWGKNEGEEMSEGISPARRHSLWDGKALGLLRSRAFFPQRDMTNKDKSVVFFPITAAIPLLLAPDKICSSHHYLAAVFWHRRWLAYWEREGADLRELGCEAQNNK